MKFTNHILRFSLFLLFSVCSVALMAQRKSPTFEKYIKQYSVIAVQHQKKYKIPARITLAQGLLESGAGQSELARKSNNHFGIKCHTGWKGGRVYHNDDYEGECFRKYKSPEHSYEDHAIFLVDRPRYSVLFDLHVKDYKGWARGLQKCGYATDRAYANRLIKLIEDYELYRYDSAKGIKQIVVSSGTVTQKAVKSRYTVYKTNGLLYVYASGNDSFETIGNSLGFTVKELVKYNEVPADFPLQPNDIVYLQKKKKRADKPRYDHVVQVGESMHSISQKYGVQVSSLYKMNKKHKDYIPEEGDVLKLR